LHKLLKTVKEKTGCEGVAVGAIASDYQRLRVENVCSRLGLTSLAYLWHQDQSNLLKNMINAKIDAITIKVASMGLKPDEHLGEFRVIALGRNMTIRYRYNYMHTIFLPKACSSSDPGRIESTFSTEQN